MYIRCSLLAQQHRVPASSSLLLTFEFPQKHIPKFNLDPSFHEIFFLKVYQDVWNYSGSSQYGEFKPLAAFKSSNLKPVFSSSFFASFEIHFRSSRSI